MRVGGGDAIPVSLARHGVIRAVVANEDRSTAGEMQIDAAGECKGAGQELPFRNQDSSATGGRGRVNRFLNRPGIHRLAIPDGPVSGHIERVRWNHRQGRILSGDGARKREVKAGQREKRGLEAIHGGYSFRVKAVCTDCQNVVVPSKGFHAH